MAAIALIMVVIIMAVWLMRESRDSHEIVRSQDSPVLHLPILIPHTYPDPHHDTQPLSELASILKMSFWTCFKQKCFIFSALGLKSRGTDSTSFNKSVKSISILCNAGLMRGVKDAADSSG